MARVLIIGDTHAPAMHESYPSFLCDMYDQWDCDTVVHIGDLADFHAISYHQKQFGLESIEKEMDLARDQVAWLTDEFPNVTYLTGNHSALPARQAADAGLPPSMLLSISDILALPSGWEVKPRHYDHIIDGVIYRHGDKGRSNQQNAAFLNAQLEFQSVVQGHYHAQAGVVYGANQSSRYFGLQVGCGTDPRSLYMEYSKIYAKRPLLGCGIVLDGEYATFEPMQMELYR
jgi:predicted phosphodiesterase